MPDATKIRTLRTGALVVLCTVAVSGCSLFRPVAAPVTPPSQGAIAIETEQFNFAMRQSAPMVERTTPEGMAALTPAPETARNAVPVLVLGSPDAPMTQEDHGGARRLAQFLCAEQPHWPRGGGSAGTPDWIEDGQWHIVGPCPEPGGTDLLIARDTNGIPLSPFTAPDPILSTSSN